MIDPQYVIFAFIFSCQLIYHELRISKYLNSVSVNFSLQRYPLQYCLVLNLIIC
jgi:hypothetical protein